MIDTIRLRKSVLIDNFYELQLNNLVLITEWNTGKEIGVYGTLNNTLRVIYRNGILIVEGSLSRYYKGNNCYILSYSEIRIAINEIETILGVDLGDAMITRLDFAENIKTEMKVHSHYVLFGDSNYYNRFIEKNTLYYCNCNRKKLFYDKGLESKNNEMLNIMRFEVRWNHSYLKKWIRKQFSHKSFLLKHLYNNNIYNALVRLWKNEYDEIKKNDILVFDLEKCMTSKQVIEELAILAIKQNGGLNKIIESIKLSKDICPFPRHETFSRVKNKLREIILKDNTLSNNKIISYFNEYVLELERKHIIPLH